MNERTLKDARKGVTTMYRITMVNITKTLDDLWTEFNERIAQILELYFNGEEVHLSDEIWKIYDEWWDYLKMLERVKLLHEDEFKKMIKLADKRCCEVIAKVRESEEQKCGA